MTKNNLTDIDIVVSSKAGLITDLNPSYLGKDVYSYARNLVRNSKSGDLGTLGNEPSNEFCFKAPNKIIGTIILPDDTIMVFSGEGESSEIGIADPVKCEYKTFLKLPCLNFSYDNPITGVSKKDFNKGIVVTFTDKKNPVRRIELKKVAKIKSCDDILLFKKITQPCISVSKGQVGTMPNGVYSIALAYVVDGQVFSDYFSITNRIQLFSESGTNSIDIEIKDLDSEFDQYSLVVVGNYVDPVTKLATKLAKIVGTYSTRTNKVSITDFINATYRDIPISSLVVKKNSFITSGIVTSNSNILLLGDLVSREEENYQLKAMSITAEYVVEQVEVDYYENDGLDVGYYADENYDFYIQGIYNTGEHTDRFHIPGRTATSFDRTLVVSQDVYEYDTQFKDCKDPGKVERWQVENTADIPTLQNNSFVCNRRVYGTGKFGYFESTELYPDNKDMFGEWANTPIRYHKFPDECKVPRYQVIDGKTYINIKGVRFKNIPAFENPDIVGYRILRSDRKGGNGTVVARGLMTNIRHYRDNDLNQNIMFSNYTVNDLSPDKYLSSTQTQFRNGKEEGFTPINSTYYDRYSFYSPHTLFEPRYSLGTEIKIESEEIADVKGRFEIVHNHPRQKLLNQFSFWLSAAVGFIESALVLLGKGKYKGVDESSIEIGLTGGITRKVGFEQDFNITSVEDLVSLDLISFIRTRVLSSPEAPIGIITLIRNILTALASLGVKIPYSIFSGITQADETFNIIYNFTGFTDYAYQYNAHALFNQSVCVTEGNKRRRLLRNAFYIPSDVVSIDDQVFNNYGRERTVYFHLNKPIAAPKNVDNSRNTISGFGICDTPTKEVSSKGVAFYVTNKAINPNQYGALGTSGPVSLHSCPLTGTETPILYGGDCIIARFQFMKKMQFFNQSIANRNFPDGVEYDYRLYRNIAYPRYWMDSTKYDFSSLLSKNVINRTTFSRTTSSKHNLDCKGGKDGDSISRIDNAFMYTSNNVVMDFIVEADYNPAFREVTKPLFYSKRNTNLSLLFRVDNLEEQEEFKINRAFSDIYTTEVFSQQQRYDFDPNDRIPTSQTNAVIYSLPSFNLQQVDNWQYFLPANYFSFREGDFGNLTGIHKLDQDRLIFLFSKSSPYISMGRDFLELEGTGRKITIGDGGLFAQDPREMLPTDNNYGSCHSRFAFSNTHLGRFYPSEKQGRILESTNLKDITREGMSFWCKNYMPIQLYKFFPDYKEVENPINSVGYLSIFDSFNEVVYFTKRDYVPKREFRDRIKWNTSTKKFTLDNLPISVRDLRYFEDASWTISYSPGDQAFISWHDWHPDWMIQLENYFMTVKGDSVWKHNQSFTSFCNFYSVDYPWEIEYVSNSGQQMETVRSLEYLLEAYRYKNDGRDRFHVLNEGFDTMIVHNSEQISPVLNMKLGNPNPEQNQIYPQKQDALSYNITYFKEENKYRVNQFWDTTKDRGEFSQAENHLFPTDWSGYRSVVNPVAIDIDKPEEQRKKFRHYTNRFRLIRRVSGNTKFLTKILNIKKQIVP